jgi:hypothetical protein
MSQEEHQAEPGAGQEALTNARPVLHPRPPASSSRTWAPLSLHSTPPDPINGRPATRIRGRDPQSRCRGRMWSDVLSDVPIAECGRIGITRHGCAAPWRARHRGYAPGRPPGMGAPMPGCGHRPTGLIDSADGAARGDLGLRDGRRRLAGVVIGLRWKPGHPPPSARGKRCRPSPAGWADGDGVTSWGGMCGRGGRSRSPGRVRLVEVRGAGRSGAGAIGFSRRR